MANYKLTGKDRRSEVIQVRITQDEKNRIKNKANAKNQTVSDYARDCCIAGFERRSTRDRRRIKHDIEQLEAKNKIMKMCNSENTTVEELSKLIMNYFLEEEWNWPIYY